LPIFLIKNPLFQSLKIALLNFFSAQYLKGQRERFRGFQAENPKPLLAPKSTTNIPVQEEFPRAQNMTT